MKLRNIIAIATVMALLAVMAAPFASTVSAAVTPPDIQTSIYVGQTYSVDLRDHLGSEYDPWFAGTSGYTLVPSPALPSWLSMTANGDGHIILSGVPTDAGTYNISIVFKEGASEYDRVIWTITVEEMPPIPTDAVVRLPYSIDLRDHLGAEYDPWFNAETGYGVRPGDSLVQEGSWITVLPSSIGASLPGPSFYIVDGSLIISGTPTQAGSYLCSMDFMINGMPDHTVSWTIVVSAPDATIDMLAGDTFSYTLEANVPSTFSIAEGDLSTVGLSLSGSTISGTAALGKTTVRVAATSIEGPTQVEYQTIGFNVYRVLAIGGTIQPTNVDGQSYSSQITVVDVDPDATGEVTLSLNQAAIDAGFTITRGSETSWALTRTSAAFVSGEVPITITATTSAGGIQQTRTLTGTVESYYNVWFTTTPSGHRGTGLNVWLVEGDGVWTYRPEARPAGTTISVSGLVSGITWSGGVLTVSPTAPLDTTTVTITATSPDGYSSTTQVLTITVWEKLVFTSRPSVENIITTVDGRNVTATVQASYYETILWDMGDGTTYEGNETITHEYAEYGQYTITATALHVLGYTAAQSVDVSISPPSVTDGLKDMGPFVAIIGALFVMIMLFAMMRG